jgi:methylthioribose-1-phosphate isomerase
LVARADRSDAAVRRAAQRLKDTRPTAVNLAWAVDRTIAAFSVGGADAALAEAESIAAEDVAANRELGRLGALLLPDGARVLTHCNAGALACAGYGTALGIVRAAAEAGKRPMVWVCETRPVLQGARLTAWELDRLGIEHRLVPDVMAGSLMASKDVDAVVVGADRVAANGDVANKIGTYPLAVLALHHAVSFMVAAPIPTIDLATPDGAAIPIEERPPEEVTMFAGTRIAPTGTTATNRAFDVTPAWLVTAIVTERGVARSPYGESLPKLAAPKALASERTAAGRVSRPAESERME